MSSRPLNIVAAAALQGLIGLVIAYEGVRVVIEAIQGRGSASFTVPLAILAFAAAAAVCYVAWGLFTLQSWSRGPVVLTQIFMLVIAYSMYTSDQMAISVGMAATAVAVLGLVLSGPVTEVLFPGGRLPGEDAPEKPKGGG
ncbi:hypothetical protein [Nocardiopsis potens]|uniref:hypothetical protein n=1 Tax=Nocardiopsis potens TaxID=1246458 RepID=UPI000345B8A1|nr:hypothetical protein [Nocardiopsis potens]